MVSSISVQDTVLQLQKFVTAIAEYHTRCYEVSQCSYCCGRHNGIR